MRQNLPAPNFAGAKGSCGAGVPAPRPPHAFALKHSPQEAGHPTTPGFILLQAARGRALS